MLGADQKAQQRVAPLSEQLLGPFCRCVIVEKRVAASFRRRKSTGWQAKPDAYRNGLPFGVMPQSHDYPVSAMPINHAIRPGPAHSAIHARTTLPRNFQFGLSFISDLVARQQMPSF